MEEEDDSPLREVARELEREGTWTPGRASRFASSGSGGGGGGGGGGGQGGGGGSGSASRPGSGPGSGSSTTLESNWGQRLLELLEAKGSRNDRNSHSDTNGKSASTSTSTSPDDSTEGESDGDSSDGDGESDADDVADGFAAAADVSGVTAGGALGAVSGGGYSAVGTFADDDSAAAGNKEADVEDGEEGEVVSLPPRRLHWKQTVVSELRSAAIPDERGRRQRRPTAVSAATVTPTPTMAGAYAAAARSGRVPRRPQGEKRLGKVPFEAVVAVVGGVKHVGEGVLKGVGRWFRHLRQARGGSNARVSGGAIE
jgi:hypothetical protein